MPFTVADNTPTGIINAADGTFIFPTAGTYEVSFGIVATALANDTPASPFFDLVKNPGTDNVIIKEINGDIFRTAGINPITVQFTVNAGDAVELHYVGSIPSGADATIIGNDAALGPNPDFSDFAFIQFTKVS